MEWVLNGEGFTILTSPGGMLDFDRHELLQSIWYFLAAVHVEFSNKRDDAFVPNT